MKIMLVDDSRTIRNIQKKVLASLGYKEIVEAADGVEALAAYKESPSLTIFALSTSRPLRLGAMSHRMKKAANAAWIATTNAASKN